MTQSRLAELRARRALAGARLDPDVSLVPLDSATNEVWAAGNTVIRVNRRIYSRLHREAELAAVLPPEVRYPQVIAAAEPGGADWLVSMRMPGTTLLRCWPALDEPDRRRAVGDLATVLRALHQTRAPDGLDEIRDPPQLLQAGPHPTAALEAALDRAAHLPNVDLGALADVADLVGSCRAAIEPFTAATLVHGDVHFQNLLWDGEQITALLDLEFARPAPADLDLDVFLRFCAFPFLFVPEDRATEVHAVDYEGVPGMLIESYPELFAHPGLLDRLRLYSISFDVRDLLATPPRGPLGTLTVDHPYRRLLAVVGRSSYLDDLRI